MPVVNARPDVGLVHRVVERIERAGAHRHERLAEGGVIMPLAARVLTKEDWGRIDAAFADNDDPLFGKARREEYRRLLALLAEHPPPPLGLGADS